MFVTKGLLGFCDADQFPIEWQQGTTQTTRLLFFGLLPAWRHSLTFKAVNDSERVLCTNEGGGLITLWNHTIKVVPVGDRSCIYLDDVEVKAGVLTIFVWAYAQLFYRYRQLRWRTLLRRVR